MELINYVSKKQFKKMKTNSPITVAQSKTVSTILNDKKHLAHVIDVFDLDLGRVSKSSKHTKKYLVKRMLHPFEVIAHKN